MNSRTAELDFTDPDLASQTEEDLSKIKLGLGEIAMASAEQDSIPPVTKPGEDTGVEREPGIEYINFDDMEAEYRKDRDLETERRKCRRLKFTRNGHEITHLTGYNTTKPILDRQYDSVSGKPYFILGVRMEERADWKNSMIVSFRADSAFSTEWNHVEGEDIGFPEIMGQDPSATELDEGLFLSVVETEEVEDDSDAGSHTNWWPRFYKGPDIRHLTRGGRGPLGMKNVTPVQLPTAQITVFTRPRNPDDEDLGGLGQVGQITLDSIEEIEIENILDVNNAPLINTRCRPKEAWWAIKCGVALIHGKTGVIGHIGRFDTEDPAYVEGIEDNPLIYWTFSGIYDHKTGRIGKMKIEAMADEFVGVMPKSPRHKRVVYTTAITEPDESGKVMMMQGVGDAETWSKVIDDPFAGLRLSLPEQRLPLAA